jgi:hypothetical protein
MGEEEISETAHSMAGMFGDFTNETGFFFLGGMCGMRREISPSFIPFEKVELKSYLCVKSNSYMQRIWIEIPMRALSQTKHDPFLLARVVEVSRDLSRATPVFLYKGPGSRHGGHGRL